MGAKPDEISSIFGEFLIRMTGFLSLLLNFLPLVLNRFCMFYRLR
jgi:hypothetical protein